VTIEEYCRLMHVEFTDDVVLAASYLQAKGLRFCVDFGYQNAWSKAEEVYENDAA
jgi:hypothetical protein